jgi:hypothetical protein
MQSSQLQFPKLHREAHRLSNMVLCAIDEDVRVYEVTRIISNILQSVGIYSRVVDGIMAGVPHSWIWIDEPTPASLLDVRAVGRMPGVQLIECGAAHAYIPGPFRGDIDQDFVEGTAMRVARQLAPIGAVAATCA